MQFTNAITFIIAALAANASAAALRSSNTNAIAARVPSPQEIEPTPIAAKIVLRQNDVDSTHPDQETAQNALDDSRAEGRRKLSGTTANCKSSACHTCMNSSTVASLAEVAGCGIVAAAAEVGTSGTATGFVVAGFSACETAIVANMAKSVVECEGMN
ncbi:hypothetical protein N0V93_000177 [Gnomoniopsis smithogilvyi]|uniref:Uncharacterized protein n=1 Tax=Gnomoniopsis smithogilvyi TaxID=1191159 RepID=A0A9W9D1H4_9PEZI|nr:hypothetical protein N0V93_000177 [Gnomoniopsis smithogilvyi]